MAGEQKRKRKVMIGTQVEGVEKLVEQEVDEDSTLRWQPREQMKFLGGRLPQHSTPATSACRECSTDASWARPMLTRASALWILRRRLGSRASMPR